MEILTGWNNYNPQLKMRSTCRCKLSVWKVGWHKGRRGTIFCSLIAGFSFVSVKDYNLILLKSRLMEVKNPSDLIFAGCLGHVIIKRWHFSNKSCFWYFQNIDFMPTILSRFDTIFIVKDEHNQAKDMVMIKANFAIELHCRGRQLTGRKGGQREQAGEERNLFDHEELKTMLIFSLMLFPTFDSCFHKLF